MSAAKRRPERFPLRVVKGAMVPADSSCASRLRERQYSVGDLVFVEIRKPRNPRFHRLAHVFGRLVTENLDAFEGMDPHGALKRLQIESGVGCDEIGLRMPGVGPCLYRVPRSLSFESMDEGEFKETMRGLCRHVAREYWRDCTADEIEAMAEAMVSEG